MKKYLFAGALVLAFAAVPFQSTFAHPEAPVVVQTPPVATTESASSVTSGGADFNGTLTDLGGASSVFVGYDLGMTTDYRFTQMMVGPTDGVSATGPFTAGRIIGGLDCETFYHYRVRVQNDAALIFGDDSTFTTGACPVLAVGALTVSADSITPTSAQLTGTLTGMGPTTIVLSGFDVGTSTDYGTTTSTSSLSATGDFTQAVTGLTCDTLYHYRATVSGHALTIFSRNYDAVGEDMTFTTGPCEVVRNPDLAVETLPASNVFSTVAFLNGHLISFGDDSSVDVGVQFNTTGVYTPATVGLYPMSIATNFSIPEQGLSCDTLYHYRVFAIGTSSTAYGEDTTFTTDPCITHEELPPSGKVWIEQLGSGLRHWISIAASTDGIKFAAVDGDDFFDTPLGYVYTSGDSGINWTTQNGSGTHHWFSIASSADGTHLVASDGFGGLKGHLHTSTDSGVTWTESTSAGEGYWSGVTSSYDGMKLAAAYGTGVATSTDAGATWTPHTFTSHIASAIASSSDGTVLAVGTGTETPTDIYVSTDSGVTWTDEVSSGIRSWGGIALSADGTKMAAADRGGYIYTSTDTGVTWTAQTGSGTHNWISIASSADGTKLAAVDNDSFSGPGGYIYLSNDSGATWTLQTIPGQRHWKSIASSADGLKLAAGDSNGYIWTLLNPPVVVTDAVTLSSGYPTLFTGEITNTGGENATERGFDFLPTEEGVTAQHVSETGSFGIGEFTLDASDTDSLGFSCGTTYPYRAYATNRAGTSYGETLSLTTSACASAPAVTTLPATSVTNSSAIFNGNVTETGGVGVHRDFVYGKTTEYGMLAGVDSEGFPGGVGAYASLPITGLECGTLYHYAAHFTNANSIIALGNDMTFTTLSCGEIAGGGTTGGGTSGGGTTGTSSGGGTGSLLLTTSGGTTTGGGTTGGTTGLGGTTGGTGVGTTGGATGGTIGGGTTGLALGGGIPTVAGASISQLDNDQTKEPTVPTETATALGAGVGGISWWWIGILILLILAYISNKEYKRYMRRKQELTK